MPYKDPERKREQMKVWRKQSIDAGYGKWLYARRKLRFDDAERFRAALEQIAQMPTSELNPDGVQQAADSMKLVAHDALQESQEAEEALGRWKGEDDGQEGS